MTDSASFLGGDRDLPAGIGAVRLGLDTLRAVLARLGHPELVVPSVLIAGTNGKGSTAAMVTAAASAAGYRVGFFHSPSLGAAREQILVDGEPLAARPYAARQTTVLRAASDAGVEPSPFEELTAIAFLTFAQAGVDVSILEAGLGGARDATNVADPCVSAVVSVGLDHRELLGDTTEAIARDKAGVFRSGRPAVVGWLSEPALATVRAYATTIGAHLDQAAEHGPWTGDLGLDGDHQRRNAAVAVRILDHLRTGGFDNLDASAVARGLAACRWPGRLEQLTGHARPIWLDAAHNPDGANALADFLEHHASRPDLVFGAFADKDTPSMLNALRPHVGQVHLVPVDSPRSWSPASATSTGDHLWPDMDSCLESILRQPTNDQPILFTGSVFFVGSVRRRLTTSGDQAT